MLVSAEISNAYTATYDSTLEKRVINDRRAVKAGMTELHRIMVVADGVIDTAHHTLVITEEEDGQRSDTIDRNEKTTLLQLVDDIPSRDAIHGEDCAMALEVVYRSEGSKKSLALQGTMKEKQSRNERIGRSPAGSCCKGGSCLRTRCREQMVDFPYIFGLLVSEQVPWELG
jgi:hypothetical protein